MATPDTNHGEIIPIPNSNHKSWTSREDGYELSQYLACKRVVASCANQKAILLLHAVGSGKSITSLCVAFNSPHENEVSLITINGLQTAINDEYNNMKNIYGKTKTDAVLKYSEEIIDNKTVPFFLYPLMFYEDLFSNMIGFNSASEISTRMMQTHFNGKVVIIDEAHKLLQFINSDKTGLFEMNLLHCLQKAHKVVFLTATPIQRDWSDFGKMIKMISKINDPLKLKLFRSVNERAFKKEFWFGWNESDHKFDVKKFYAFEMALKTMDYINEKYMSFKKMAGAEWNYSTLTGAPRMMSWIANILRLLTKSVVNVGSLLKQAYTFVTGNAPTVIKQTVESFLGLVTNFSMRIKDVMIEVITQISSKLSYTWGATTAAVKKHYKKVIGLLVLCSMVYVIMQGGFNAAYENIKTDAAALLNPVGGKLIEINTYISTSTTVSIMKFIFSPIHETLTKIGFDASAIVNTAFVGNIMAYLLNARFYLNAVRSIVNTTNSIDIYPMDVDELCKLFSPYISFNDYNSLDAAYVDKLDKLDKAMNSENFLKGKSEQLFAMGDTNFATTLLRQPIQTIKQSTYKTRLHTRAHYRTYINAMNEDAKQTLTNELVQLEKNLARFPTANVILVPLSYTPSQQTIRLNQYMKVFVPTMSELYFTNRIRGKFAFSADGDHLMDFFDSSFVENNDSFKMFESLRCVGNYSDECMFFMPVEYKDIKQITGFPEETYDKKLYKYCYFPYKMSEKLMLQLHGPVRYALISNQNALSAAPASNAPAAPASNAPAAPASNAPAAPASHAEIAAELIAGDILQDGGDQTVLTKPPKKWFEEFEIDLRQHYNAQGQMYRTVKTMKRNDEPRRSYMAEFSYFNSQMSKSVENRDDDFKTALRYNDAFHGPLSWWIKNDFNVNLTNYYEHGGEKYAEKMSLPETDEKRIKYINEMRFFNELKDITRGALLKYRRKKWAESFKMPSNIAPQAEVQTGDQQTRRNDYIQAVFDEKERMNMRNINPGVQPNISNIDPLANNTTVFSCPKFDKALELINKARQRFLYLPVVYSNFEENGLYRFSAYLTSKSLPHIMITPETLKDKEYKPVEKSQMPYFKWCFSNLRNDSLIAFNDENKHLYLLSDYFVHQQPCCVLIHSSLQEGLSLVKNEVMICLESMISCGNQEQVYGRVIRSYSVKEKDNYEYTQELYNGQYDVILHSIATKLNHLKSIKDKEERDMFIEVNFTNERRHIEKLEYVYQYMETKTQLIAKHQDAYFNDTAFINDYQAYNQICKSLEMNEDLNAVFKYKSEYIPLLYDGSDYAFSRKTKYIFQLYSSMENGVKGSTLILDPRANFNKLLKNEISDLSALYPGSTTDAINKIVTRHMEKMSGPTPTIFFKKNLDIDDRPGITGFEKHLQRLHNYMYRNTYIKDYLYFVHSDAIRPSFITEWMQYNIVKEDIEKRLHYDPQKLTEMSKAGLISDANGDRTPEQYFFEKIDLQQMEINKMRFNFSKLDDSNISKLYPEYNENDPNDHFKGERMKCVTVRQPAPVVKTKRHLTRTVGGKRFSKTYKKNKRMHGGLKSIMNINQALNAQNHENLVASTETNVELTRFNDTNVNQTIEIIDKWYEIFPEDYEVKICDEISMDEMIAKVIIKPLIYKKVDINSPLQIAEAIYGSMVDRPYIESLKDEITDIEYTAMVESYEQSLMLENRNFDPSTMLEIENEMKAGINARVGNTPYGFSNGANNINTTRFAPNNNFN